MIPTPVRQLIYTNVEAPRSPTGQRGFQVWRYTAGLEPSVRRAVEDRVKDFRLPPRVRADAGVERKVGFPVPGGYAVAQTVSLPEPDKFGRGGRFFAHAVVIADADFQALGCDPFAPLDHFHFLERPDQSAPGDGRPSAELDVGMTFTAGPPAREAPAPPRFAELLAHVTGPTPLPVLVVAPPEEVEGVVRAVVRVLPPQLRARFEFDTLAGGAPAAHWRVVGGYSADAVKTWPGRRWVVYDVKTGAAKPELTARPSTLPLRLLTVDGWAKLPDDVREATFTAAEVLEAGRPPDAATRKRLTDAAGAVLAAAGANVPIGRLIDAKVEREIPAAFRKLESVRTEAARHFALPPHQALTGLDLPIPEAVVAAGLVAELCRTPAVKPEPDVLGELNARPALQTISDEHRGWKLSCVSWRWRSTPDDVEVLCRQLGTAGERVQWLQKWVLSSLDDEFRTALPVILEGRLPLTARPPDPAVQNQMRLRMAADARTDEPAWRGVRHRLLFHADQRKFVEEVERLRRADRAGELAGLLDEAAAALDAPCWYGGNVKPLMIGLRGPAEVAPGIQALMRLAERRAEVAVRRFREARGLAPDSPAAPTIVRPREGDVTPLVLAILKPNVQENILQTHRDHLQKLKLSDGDFEWAARELARVANAVPVFSDLPQGGWMVGLRLHSRDPSQPGFRHLFRALASGIAPQADEDRDGLLLRCDPARFWLLYDILAQTATR